MSNSRIQSTVWHALRLAGVRLDTPGATEVARSITWLIEQQKIVLNRFPIQQNDLHTLEGLSAEGYWQQKFAKFLSRAELLSLESPEGRQCIAEHFATSLGLTASMWRVYGPPASVLNNYTQDSRLIKIE